VDKQLTIAEVMTPSPRTISVNAHLSEAKAMMENLGVSQLPVVEDSLVESILTDRDIKRFTLPAHKISDSEDLLVSDIATTRAFIADKNDPLEQVLRQMVGQQTAAVLVLDQGELAGIFTENDACKVLAELLARDE